MKILLVSMNAYVPNPEHFYPLSLGFLSPILEKNGHTVQNNSLFNMQSNEAEEIFVNTLHKFNPDIVGFNCITQNRQGTYSGIRLAKQFNKNIVVVLGGVHSTVMCDQLLENFPIDFIIKGEGEIAILELLDSLDDKENKIRVASSRVKLNTLPLPDHSYAKEWIKKHGKAHLVTSRGCPGSCIFCSTGAFWGKDIRFRSPELIVDEIEMLINDFGISDFLFHDDTFNITTQRAMNIAQEILDRNLNITWTCNARVHPVNKEMLELMKKSGCVQMRFGIETGSDKIMKTLNKHITKEQITNCFKLCNEVGIETLAFMMVGLPGETKETINETVEFMSKLVMTEKPAVSLTYLYPGTALYEYCKDKGIIDDTYWLETGDDFILEETANVHQLEGWAGLISTASTTKEDK